MDFKKPGHAYETTDRAADDVREELPAPQPQPAVVKKGPSIGQKIMTALLLILLVAATGYAVYAYLSEQQVRTDLSKAKEELSKVQGELSSLKDGKDSVVARAEAAEETAKRATDLSDKAQQSRATLAASYFYCMIKDFGCDKVSSVVTKFQPYKVTEGATAGQNGFAIVTATPAGNGSGAKFFLKSEDGIEWAVFYDGQNVPSQVIADRFELPASFR